jgi:hypothetical protein
VKVVIAIPISCWLISWHDAHAVRDQRVKADLDILEVARPNFQYLSRTAQKSAGDDHSGTSRETMSPIWAFLLILTVLQQFNIFIAIYLDISEVSRGNLQVAGMECFILR